MKTLYVRIVLVFILITFISSAIALLFTNLYYTSKLQSYSERDMLGISKEIRELYESVGELDLKLYLTRIAGMGFQIYAVDAEGRGQSFGDPFKNMRLEQDKIDQVLHGESYLGLMEPHHWLKVVGYFENSLRNSVGLPVDVNGERYALFIRPNLEKQIGEVRILLAILMSYTFLFSLLLIIMLTRYIVGPLKQLKGATKKIVEGNYQIELDVRRSDEIGDLARHFSHMADSLKRLDEMRQEFVANVSHEFQTPVTSIQGFTQAILNKETSAEEERHYLQIIHEESKRLSSLSKQLLTLAALDKEAQLAKKTAYRLDEQIRQILIVLEWQWSDKQLVIEPDLPEIIVTADEQLMYQVWFNLITNSIKFSRKGDTIRIQIAAERDIEVTIADTGIGIPAADLPHIFDRFYKADKARNRSQAGSGLGLSISRKIVELHGGTVEAASEPGVGTSVTVRLPHS